MKKESFFQRLIHPALLKNKAGKKSRIVRRIFLFLGAVALVAFGAMVVVVILVGIQLFALRKGASDAEHALATYDILSASRALTSGSEALQRISTYLSWLPFLSAVPVVGETYTATVQTVAVTQDTVDVAQDALKLAEEIISAIDRAHSGTSFDFLDDPRSYADFSDDERHAALMAFAQSAPELRLLRVSLALTAQDLARIDAQALRVPEAVAALTRAQEEIPKLVTALDILTPFAEVTREFAGLDSEAQFLVLYLNNAELRPGGGFIGAYSIMNIENGEVGEFFTEDSYFADQFVQYDPSYTLAPPYPLFEQLGVGDWYFRDAAWSPSFAQTAFDARQLLRQELATGGQAIPDAQHILGITPNFIARVLDFTGPMSVNGVTYTGSNLYDLLQYEVEQGFVTSGAGYENRKAVLKTVSETLLDRLLSLSPSSWVSFFTLFSEELQNKQVLLASTNEDVQAHLRDAGWAGVPKPAQADDVFMLVDANLAALKTDPVVDRTISYTIHPNGEGYRATAEITYAHTAGFDWKTTRYRSYTRIFVPLGATLVSVSGGDGEARTEDALGMTSFGTMMIVEPKTTETLTFVYDLPATVTHAIDRGAYTLGVFKQNGAEDPNIALDLTFTDQLMSAVPAEHPSEFSNASYRTSTSLSSDTFFRVWFE